MNVSTAASISPAASQPCSTRVPWSPPRTLPRAFRRACCSPFASPPATPPRVCAPAAAATPGGLFGSAAAPTLCVSDDRTMTSPRSTSKSTAPSRARTACGSRRRSAHYITLRCITSHHITLHYTRVDPRRDTRVRSAPPCRAPPARDATSTRDRHSTSSCSSRHLAAVPRLRTGRLPVAAAAASALSLARQTPPRRRSFRRLNLDLDDVMIRRGQHYTNAGGAVADRNDEKEQFNIALLKHKWPGAIAKHATRGENEARSRRARGRRGAVVGASRTPKPKDRRSNVTILDRTSRLSTGRPTPSSDRRLNSTMS